MNNPLFSIIVPVYNVEPYIATCIESILCQSVTDFELLLVDDGRQTIQEWCVMSLRVKIVVSECFTKIIAELAVLGIWG